MKYVLQVEGQDRSGTNLPSLVGPFDSREDAWAWGHDHIANGESNVAPLVAP